MKRLQYINGDLDRIDKAILDALGENARIPTSALAKRVGMSAPSVAERIRRLEEAGVIRAYTVQVDAAALGRPISAWMGIRPTPGMLHTVSSVIRNTPEIVECDRVTGEDCFFAKVHVATVQELERIIDGLLPYAVTNTSIIQSSPMPPRLPPLAASG